MPVQKTVLIVDDNESNRHVLKQIIGQFYCMLEARDCAEALTMLQNRTCSIACIMLDLHMPVVDGYAFLQSISKSDLYKNIPIIAVTGSDDNESEKKALRYGAWDFVSLPFDPEIVLFRLKNAIERSLLSAFEQLKFLAEFDTLTGIYNKSKFFSMTRDMLDQNPGRRFAVCRMDVDRFQLVNSYFGTDEGDRLLKYIGQTLRVFAQSNSPCTYGRLGSDAFAICLTYTDNDEYTCLMNQLQSNIREYNISFNLVVAFGIYIVEDRVTPVDVMIDRAYLASRTVKGNYLKNCAFYTSELSQAIEKEQEIINDMNIALRDEQFQIVVQPKYSLRTNLPIGGEVLVRWIHPEKGSIPLSVFLPVFEKNGFIARLDAFVWEKTCALLRKWIDDGIMPYPLSVNVSRADLYNPRIADIFCDITKKYDIAPALLHLEVTESAYMDNPQVMRDVVHTLRARGFTILMDDFGSGYSSLNTLKDIEVDYLKIDVKFLGAAMVAGRGESILASIVRMSKWLCIPVIAEGAERGDQVAFLRSIGCEYVQGFFFSQPISPEDYLALIGENTPILSQQESSFDGNSVWVSNPQMDLLFSDSIQALGLFEYQAEPEYYECLRVNNAFLALFGYDTATTSLRDPLEPVIMEYRDVVLESVRAAVNSRTCGECKYMYRAADGRLAWVELKLKYISCMDNKHLLIGSISDVSEQQQIETELFRYRSAISELHSSMNRMLVVDDQRINRMIVSKIFHHQFEVLEAANGQEALDVLRAQDNKIDIILLDMVMPIMDGREFLTLKSKMHEIESIPVVIVTADDTPSMQVNMLALGANDYIVKPIIPEVAVRRIDNVLESSNRFRIMLREYKNAIDRANADPLTHLYNRAAAEELIGNILSGKARQQHALIMLDIDDYKIINDTYGHSVGDELLMEIGRKLMYFFRTGDIIARMGGDEFCVLMMNIGSAENAMSKCRALCRMINSTTIGEKRIKITCSVGIALSDCDISFYELYKRADSALYVSKNSGKNQATLYDKVHNGPLKGHMAHAKF